MIDTAYSYTGGQSEETIGEALSPFPDGCIVATKGGGGPSAGRGRPDVRRDQIARARKVVPIAAVQNHYSLSERKWDAVVDYCTREGIVFVPFFPLRGNAGGAV